MPVDRLHCAEGFADAPSASLNPTPPHPLTAQTTKTDLPGIKSASQRRLNWQFKREIDLACSTLMTLERNINDVAVRKPHFIQAKGSCRVANPLCRKR